ncbi:hypothetical protein N7457_007008 [Penicillium paradoxum]|uniref:uncharacterized protein n=1 Tax=Penicillium paradoxum TaxID=176176 RepID=UPI002549A5C7|nr:uncharacterized protein N7457_007008 [Penicillium paradoxum]KAJ5779288.1 hypothetical protein N7457_007008 [Penicillium paradoxum]
MTQLPNPRPPKIWPHAFDAAYVYKRLNVPQDPTHQQILRDLAQEVYDEVGDQAAAMGRTTDNLFKSSRSRDNIHLEWHKRLDRVPTAVTTHIRDKKALVSALYRLTTALGEDLEVAYEARGDTKQPSTRETPTSQIRPSPSTQEQGNIQEQGQPRGLAQRLQLEQGLRQSAFDYNRPNVLPNVDIQIIRAERPDMPIAIRLSDLLRDKSDPLNVSSNGDWINISNIEFEFFKQNLVAEGYFNENETIWLSYLSLDQLDPQLLPRPHTGESRLTALNFTSTILRTIHGYWVNLKCPSPDPLGQRSDSPLVRPNMTIIIRSSNMSGGALNLMSALARPEVAMGSNASLGRPVDPPVAAPVASSANRTLGPYEQRMAAYQAKRRETAKPRRRTRRQTQTTVNPAPDPAANSSDILDPGLLDPALFNQEAFGPPIGQGNDDNLAGLLDPDLFNTEGLADKDLQAMDAFLAQNNTFGRPEGEGEFGEFGEFDGGGEFGGDQFGRFGGY